MKGYLLAVTALAAIALVAACSNSDEEAVPSGSATGTAGATNAPASNTPAASITAAPSGTPAPMGTLWRWGNVTIVVPDDSGILVIRNIPGVEESPSGGTTITLLRGDSARMIDANTGEMFLDQVGDGDRPELNNITATLSVSTNADGRPWPYEDKEPNYPKIREAHIMYWRPDPAAGVEVNPLFGDSASGGSESLVIETAWSRRLIDGDTGKILPENDKIEPQDAEAFERWTAAVETVP